MGATHHPMTSVSLAETLFAVDEEGFGRDARCLAQRRFERLIDTLQADQVRSMPAFRQLAAVSALLFGAERFRYQREPRHEVITLTGTLLRNRGACLGLTSLYFSLADALGLPARPRLYDGHVTICHTGLRPPRDISLGCKTPLYSPPVPRNALSAASGKPRILTRREFVGLYLSNSAVFVQLRNGQALKALDSLDAGSRCFPRYPGVWINRAAVLLSLGDTKTASVSLERALRLDPGPVYARAARHLQEHLERRRAISTSSVPPGWLSHAQV
jgi:regulator of sirC expression with transglutaminase-like and TPR domain